MPDPSAPNPPLMLNLHTRPLDADPLNAADHLNIEDASAAAAITTGADIDDVTNATTTANERCAVFFDCDGKEAAAAPNVSDCDDGPRDAMVVTPRLAVVASPDDTRVTALRYLELMVGQMIGHASTDNLEALTSKQVTRAEAAAGLPEQVFKIKLGAYSLIADHPNLVRLLAPWTEMHRCVQDLEGDDVVVTISLSADK